MQMSAERQAHWDGWELGFVEARDDEILFSPLNPEA